MKTTKSFTEKIISYLFILLILNYSVGCNSYYKVLRTPAIEIDRFASPEKIKSRFIVHQKGELYVLRNIIVDSISISGEIDSPGNSLVFYSEEAKNKRYNSSNEEILKEVHIYLKQDVATLEMGSVNILLSEIIEVRLIVIDEDETTSSKIVGTFVAVIALAVLGLALTALVASSMGSFGA